MSDSRELHFDLSLEHELLGEDDDGGFSALVAANHKWLGHYARMHATFSIEPSLLERNSIWMNAYFQKHRMITSPWSSQAKTLIKKHKRVVLERLRCGPSLHAESEFAAQAVEPIAALMFAASGDRCPEVHLEYLLAEAADLLACQALRTHANRSGFAGCVFRFLTQYTDEKKRILCLELLVRLADDDADAVVHACQVAAQGQQWQPNMFIYTLPKRHSANTTIRDLVTELLAAFGDRMPITSPIQLVSPRSSGREAFALESHELQRTASPPKRAHTLPSLTSSKPLAPMTTAGGSSMHALHSPTTTMSSLYVDAPSPYAPHTRLPIARPPTSPLEQSRRARIFSTPKLAVVEGETHRRCRTPNARDSGRMNPLQLAGIDSSSSSSPRSLSPMSTDAASVPRSPPKRVTLSTTTTWDPESLNSVSGFAWWWRSLPPHHASLEPTQKLKMVTKAAVRLHTSGDWPRAIELYQLALSMDINDDVAFRLRVNLACAYEAAHELTASVDAFRAALALSPTDAYAQFKLGEVLSATGAFAEARALFEGVSSAYPQAADALVQLTAAEARKQQDDDAMRAATANAKLQRSPSKKKRVQRLSDELPTVRTADDVRSEQSATAIEPPVRSPTTLSRASSKKGAATLAPIALATSSVPQSEPVSIVTAAASSNDVADSSELQHATLSADAVTTEQQVAAASEAPVAKARAVVSVGTMAELQTASVGTATDDSSAFVAELVQRCVALSVDLPQLVARLDPQRSGRIWLASAAELVHVLWGVDITVLSIDAMARELQRVLSVDCERDGAHVFVRYAQLLTAYEALTSSRASCARIVDRDAVQHALEALAAAADEQAFVQHVAEANALAYVHDALQRAVTRRGNGDARTDNVSAGRDSGPRCTDVDMHAVDDTVADAVTPPPHTATVDSTAKHGQVDNAAADDPADNEETTDAVGHITPLQSASAVGDADSYTTLSPRSNSRRDAARRDTILRREASRIFARKHVHCLRALRDVAVRARQHHAAQCEARTFLVRVAINARTRAFSGGSSGDVDSRQHTDRCDADLRDAVHVEGPHEGARSSGAQLERAAVLAAAHSAYSAAASAAVARVVLARELAVVQTLARRFVASVCALPLAAFAARSSESSRCTPVDTRSSVDAPSSTFAQAPVERSSDRLRASHLHVVELGSSSR